MEKHFEAPSREEAIRAASDWWRAQRGATLVSYDPGQVLRQKKTIGVLGAG
jgi:hypothetical protein